MQENKKSTVFKIVPVLVGLGIYYLISLNELLTLKLALRVVLFFVWIKVGGFLSKYIKSVRTANVLAFLCLVSWISPLLGLINSGCVLALSKSDRLILDTKQISKLKNLSIIGMSLSAINMFLPSFLRELGLM
jgi:pheromone shutdown protein TraB